MKTALLRGILIATIVCAVTLGFSSLPSQDASIRTAPSEQLTASSTPTPALPNFAEVVDSCDPLFEGSCVWARSGPGTDFPAIAKLRTGLVFAIATTTVTDSTGRVWYQMVFNEWIRYPERVRTPVYVASPYVRAFTDVGAEEAGSSRPSLLEQAKEQLGLAAGKHIIVDRSDQKLYAYEGETLFLESSISTGLDLTPTPRGTFAVYKKTPSRYMQGPLPGISDEYYDLPGVPWNMYFTDEGGAIHGAYWHAAFGTQWSHGCVNLPLDTAQTLYAWTPVGTPVLVRD